VGACSGGHEVCGRRKGLRCGGGVASEQEQCEEVLAPGVLAWRFASTRRSTGPALVGRGHCELRGIADTRRGSQKR